MHKLHLENLHFDTTKKWEPSFQQVFNHSSDNPFSLTFTLPSQLDRIKKIFLKSVELPVGFTNIRSENNSNTLTISINSVVCTIAIPSAQYNINTLLSTINDAFVSSGIYSGSNSNLLPIFTLSGQKIKITVPNAPYSIATIEFTSKTILSTVILGFSYNYQIIGSNTITSPNNYNIAYDTYLSVQLPYVNHKSTSATNQQISFKIPYNGYANSIFYSVENTQFSQYVETNESNCVLGNLKIVVVDRYSFPINNNGLDWSFTLGFQRDLTPHHYTHHEQQLYIPENY